MYRMTLKFFPSNLLCPRFSDTKVKDYYTYNYDKFSFGVYESVNSSLQLNFMYTAWHFATRCICRYDLLKIILTPFDWSFIMGVFLGGREQRLGYLQALFFFIMQTVVFYRDSTIEKKIPVTWHMFEIANQLLDVSLAQFSAMNERQRVLFLKCELSRLPLINKIDVMNKIIHGCLEMWNFSSRVQL